METACVHIYQGNGKGKTTAAAGLCLRALGAGYTAIWAAFLKGNCSAERSALASFNKCTVYACPAHVSFTFCMSEEEKQTLRAFYKEQLQRITASLPTTDIIVLDEVLDAVDTGLVDEEDVLTLLETAETTELVLTGRHASPALTAKADYITTMHADRHPFESGQAARKGIEF